MGAVFFFSTLVVLALSGQVYAERLDPLQTGRKCKVGYLREVTQHLKDSARYPKYTAEELKDLAIRYQRSTDATEKKQIEHDVTLSVRRFTVQQALRWWSPQSRLSITDILQIADISVRDALIHFDPARGPVLSVVAHWVRGRVTEAMFHDFRAASGLPLTTRARAYFFRRGDVHQEIEKKGLAVTSETLATTFNEVMIERRKRFDRATAPEAIAELKRLELWATPGDFDKVDAALESYFSAPSISGLIGEVDGEGRVFTPQVDPMVLASAGADDAVNRDQHSARIRVFLTKFRGSLNSRNRIIWDNLVFPEEGRDPHSSAKIAKDYGVTRQAVESAAKKLRAKLKEYLKQRLPPEDLEF